MRSPLFRVYSILSRPWETLTPLSSYLRSPERVCLEPPAYLLSYLVSCVPKRAHPFPAAHKRMRLTDTSKSSSSRRPNRRLNGMETSVYKPISHRPLEMLPKPTNDFCPKSFVGRTTTTRRSSKPKLRRPTMLGPRERRPKGWNGSGEPRKLSKQRKRGGRGVSLPAVGIETGIVAKTGVVGRGVERLKERKTHRGAARRDVEDVALNLKMTDPDVLPDVDPMTRTSHTVPHDAAPIPMKTRTEINHTVLLDALNVHIDPVHHAVAQSHLVLPLLSQHLPLFRQKWTSISSKRMTLD